MITLNQLPAYAFGSLQFAGIDWRTRAGILTRAFANYRKVTAHGYHHLPFYLVYDLQALIELGFQAPFSMDSDRGGEADSNRSTLRSRYEREILGRLLQAPDVTNAIELASTSPDAEKVRLHFLLLLLSQFGKLYPDTNAINPAELREVAVPHPSSIDTAALLSEAKLDVEERFADPLSRFLESANEQIRWGQLVQEEDFFELTHLDVLTTGHLRVGCRQILQFDRRLTKAIPLQIDLTQHESGADTTFLDETHYPSGGLTGLTNRGSFENLLTSELIYMDESAGGVSLFDLRYIEGELLFYLRDSGILRRKRRAIHFVIDLGDLFHVKSTAYQYQFSVLAQGFCLRLLRDLFQIFESDSLRFVFHYLPAGDPEELEREVSVMELLLHDDVRHGWVRFAMPESIQLDQLTDERRKSYAIILSGPSSSADWEEKLRLAQEEQIPLYAAHLRFGADQRDALNLPLEGVSEDEMIDRKEQALTQILS